MRHSQLAPFGYAVEDIDLREEPRADIIAALKVLLNDQGFVLFRGQDLDARQQAVFSRAFGPFSGHNASDREGHARNPDGSFRLRIYRNTEGVGSAPELDFHSDNAHNPHSLRYLTLYGIDFDTQGRHLEGGETLLASAAAAVERLPAYLRALLESRECRLAAQAMGSHLRPCIERHCETGREYLVPSSLTESIVGLDPDQFAEVMTRLRAVLYDPAHVYRHAWREGDLLLWDNRLLHHGRGRYDNTQTRTIRRCAIADANEPTAIH